MRLVFFGTSNFSLPSLEAIAKSKHKILAVVTQPDRKKGRNLSLSSPPVKILASKYDLKIEQPGEFSSGQFAAVLKNYKADLFVVIAFGEILNNEFLSIPKLFSLNLHGSLLPKYRGPAPINWAIINGETKTGITVIKMDGKIDHGDILIKKSMPIVPADNALTLSQKLAHLGAEALVESLDLIEKGKPSFYAQNEAEVTFAPKLKKSDGLINWSEEAVNIHNKVRGLFPWPGSFTYLDKKILKILDSEVTASLGETGAIPGTILEIKQDGLVIKTGNGSLLIKQLQLEGANAMGARQFSLGRRLEKGTRLGL